MIYDWKAFLLVFAIVCVLYMVTRWAQNRVDKWLDKKYWGDKE